MTGTVSRERAAALQYGVMFIPGLAGAWPELRDMVGRIFAQRVAKLPWLPQDWLVSVQRLQNENPNDLVTFAPSRRANVGPTGQFIDESGPVSADIPLFLDDDAKINAWMSIYSDLNRARSNYAAARAAAGRAELDALYAKAAFWDASYKIAVFARDLPSNIVKVAGGGVVDVVGTFLPDSLKQYAKWVAIAIAIIIVGGIVLWYRGKLANLVKGFKGGAPRARGSAPAKPKTASPPPAPAPAAA